MSRIEIDEVERRLRRQRLPGPPEALASRILSAAVVLPSPAAISWSDRLWFSRPARVGWAAALLLLLAFEIALSPGRTDTSPEQRAPDSTLAGLAADLSLDPSWNERLAVTEGRVDPGTADLEAAVNAL